MVFSSNCGVNFGIVDIGFFYMEIGVVEGCGELGYVFLVVRSWLWYGVVVLFNDVVVGVKSQFEMF